MRRFMPVVALFLISPLIAEIIFGATPLSNIQAILVVAPLYGAGALLIREIVRWRGGGWGRIALLGVAYAILEEGIALQSMFNPDLFNAGAYGGQAFGINWVWSEWTIGYHTLWSIMIPILLAELLFPDRRSLPWLGRVGTAIVGVLYGLAVLAHSVIFRFFVAPNFRTPLHLMIGAGVAVVALVALALSGEPVPVEPLPDEPMRDAPSPWIAGIAAFVASGLWFGLLHLPQVLRSGVLVLVPMLLGVALVVGSILVLRNWTAPDRRWTDLHRLALVMGTVLVVMLVGYFWVTAGNPVDQMFQGIVSLITFFLLVLFAYSLHRREQLHLVHQG